MADLNRVEAISVWRKTATISSSLMGCRCRILQPHCLMASCLRQCEASRRRTYCMGRMAQDRLFANQRHELGAGGGAALEDAAHAARHRQASRLADSPH